MPIGAFKLNSISKAAAAVVASARTAPAVFGTAAAQLTTVTTTGGQFGGYFELDQDEYTYVYTRALDTAWNFNGSKAWTIEWWWMRTSTLSSTSADYWTLNGIPSSAFGIYTDTVTPNNFKLNVGGALVYTGAVPTTMTHMALVSTGSNTFSLYVGGSRVYTGAYSRSDNKTVFNLYAPGFGATPKLRFDEIRVSNNARYTGTSFTVPTSAFTDDSNTIGLFHANGTVVDDFTPTTKVDPTYGVKLGVNSPATLARYADTGITETITSSNAGITFAVWVKPTLANHNATNGWALIALNQADDNSALYITLRDDGGIRFYRQYVSGFQDLNPLVTGANSGITTANQWYHIAISATNGATPQVYVNGVSKTVTGGSINANNFRFDVITKIYVGGTGYLLNDSYGDSFAQLYVDNVYTDLSTNIGKFYNNGYVGMGSTGTLSGLPQPLMFHDGNTTTGYNESGFAPNRGRTTGVYLSYNLLDLDTGTIANA